MPQVDVLLQPRVSLHPSSLSFSFVLFSVSLFAIIVTEIGKNKIWSFSYTLNEFYSHTAFAVKTAILETVNSIYYYKLFLDRG